MLFLPPVNENFILDWRQPFNWLLGATDLGQCSSNTSLKISAKGIFHLYLNTSSEEELIIYKINLFCLWTSLLKYCLCQIEIYLLQLLLTGYMGAVWGWTEQDGALDTQWLGIDSCCPSPLFTDLLVSALKSSLNILCSFNCSFCSFFPDYVLLIRCLNFIKKFFIVVKCT